MSRSDSERVGDMREACRRLAEIVELSRAEYDSNWLICSAASYELAVIGEAMAHPSQDFLEKHSDLPARQAKSLRNLVMHEYFRIDPNILWDTITIDVPNLAATLRSLGIEGAVPTASDSNG